MYPILCFFASVLLVATPHFAHAQAPNSKVAVIVSAGDLGALEDSLKATEKSAVQTYEKLGFKVVIVGGVNKMGRPLSAESLKQTLGELRNVKDLRLDFLGHGGIAKVPANYPASDIPFSRAREINSFDPTVFANAEKNEVKRVWFASNLQSADAKYYGMKAKSLGLQTNSAKPIDHEQIKNALDIFHKQNPETIATVNMLNCYSGAVAQVLRQDPKTIVYANSPHNTVAMDRSERMSDEQDASAQINTRNGINRYYKIIEGEYRGRNGDSSRGNLSFEAARVQANSGMSILFQTDPDYVNNIGRSPSLESIVGWCESGRPKALKTPRKIGKDIDSEIPVLSNILSELRQSRSRFEIAENSPSPLKPKFKYVDELRKSFAECKAKAGKTIAAIRTEVQKDVQVARKIIALNKADPKGPMRHLVEAYEKNLSDSRYHPTIVTRFKSSIENDIANLKSDRLPEDRWGGLRTIIDGIKTGKITDEWIVSKLKSQVKEMREACVDGDPFKAPCYPEMLFANRELSSYLLGHQNQAKDRNSISKSCSSKFDSFSCIVKLDPESIDLGPTIEKYWFAPEAIEQSEIKPNIDVCSSTQWEQYRRAKRNVELDEACFKDFAKHAPESELKNIERLQILGTRDARGYSDDPMTPIQKNSPSEVKR